MLVDEELATEMLAKIGSSYKGNNQNKDKKASHSSNKEVRVINRYMEYSPIRTTYAQVLECLLAKGKINLLEMRPLTIIGPSRIG